MSQRERRVKVIYSAEIQGYRKAMAELEQANKKAKQAAEAAGKAADKAAEDINKQKVAHYEAAKAVGLQYDKTGQLVTMNGKAVSSQQAAAHGLQTFSKEAYLAGRAAVAAGEAAEQAAKVAAAAEKKAAEAAEKRKDAIQNVGHVSTITGLAITAAVGAAVKSYADFDKQMSSVQAATHASASEMDQLRKASVEAGADTSFSAVEAGQAVEELSKAGVKTSDILSGGLKGALNLAAAGSLDVADAAEFAASAMTQFGLQGKDIPHIADLLAAGAGKAQGSVQDMGLALSYAGIPAKGLGNSIEETTGAIALFASNGIIGEKAGTALRGMLVSMTNPAEKTKKRMDELGISFFDAKGKFIGLEGTAGLLQERLGGLDDETRNAALAQIFGTEALGAAQALYAGGPAKVREWTNAVNDSGYAAETAGLKQDNLAGDIERLGGSIDSVFLKSGSGANDYLRDLAQGAEEAVDWIGQLDPKALSAAATVAGLVGAAALLGGAFITVVPKIRDTRDALNDLAPAGGRARDALGKVAKAGELLGALTVGTMILAKLAEADYMSKIDEGMGRVANVLADVAHNSPGAAAGLDSLFKNKEGEALIRDVDSLDTALKRTFRPDADRQFNDWGESVINSMTGVKGSSQILGDSFKRVDETMAQLVSSGKADDAAKVFDRLRKSADSQGISVDELKKKFPEYADALQKADAESKNAAASGDKAAGAIGGVNDKAAVAKQSAEDLAKALEDVGLSADGSVTDIDKFAKSLFNAGLLNLSASDATIAYESAIDALTDSVKENGKTLDVTTEKGRNNQTAYNNLAKAAMDTAEAHAAEKLATEGSAAAQDSLQASLQASYTDLVNAAGQFGITGDAADDMARKALGIPKDVPIKTWVEDSASAKLDAIKGKADGLDGRVVNLSVVEQYTRFISEKKNPTEADLNGDTFRPGGTLQVPGLTGGATGGKVSEILGFRAGGRLPYPRPSDMTKDNLIGFVNGGRPIALQGQEWVVNGRSSDAYDAELRMINAGTFPKLKEYSAVQAGYAPASSAAGSSTTVHLSFDVHETTASREVVTMLMGEVKNELNKAGVKLGGIR